MSWIFHCLGFKQIGAIFDGDKPLDFKSFCKEYNQYGYKAWIIPSDDVRDQPERNIKRKEGLVNEKGELKAEYTDHMKKMFGEISGFLQDTNKPLNCNPRRIIFVCI